MSNVLVVAAHPDDEILGVGATVAKHAESGDVVQCLILGEGQTSRYESREYVDKSLINELHENTMEAAKILGYKNVEFADFPDNRFDRIDLLDIIKFIEKKICEFKPQIIYTHHGKDLNIDHQRTFQAVMTATRPVNNSSIKEIYTFETLSSSEWNFGHENLFAPNTFINVERYIKHKFKAMECYTSELCNFPHPRSIEGIELLAKHWGMTVGKLYVEAFECIRKVVD